MARILVVELLDALAEIGLDHLDPDRSHVVPEAALLGQHRLALDERLSAIVAQDGVDDLVVLGGVAGPMHLDPVRSRIGLELVEIFVEMGERVLLDRRGERPEFLPFGNAVHLAVALLPQVPEPLVMHLLVLGSGDEARGGFCLVDRPVAMDPSATRLRLGMRSQRLRRALGMVQAAAAADDGIGILFSPQLPMQHGAVLVGPLACRAHALAPFRIWAMWMNFMGTPMRSAQPC